MADYCDEAQEIQDYFLRRALRNHAARRDSEEATPRGRCLNCEEPVEDDRIYCDRDCQQDYEKYLKARAATYAPRK